MQQQPDYQTHFKSYPMTFFREPQALTVSTRSFRSALEVIVVHRRLDEFRALVAKAGAEAVGPSDVSINDDGRMKDERVTAAAVARLLARLGEMRDAGTPDVRSLKNLPEFVAWFAREHERAASGKRASADLEYPANLRNLGDDGGGFDAPAIDEPSRG